jgi:hypothetical protein
MNTDAYRVFEGGALIEEHVNAKSKEKKNELHLGSHTGSVAIIKSSYAAFNSRRERTIGVLAL